MSYRLRLEAEVEKLREQIRVLDPQALERGATTAPVDSRTETLSPLVQADVEGQVEAIFTSIDRLARDRRVEDLIPQFLDLDRLMRQYGKFGTDKTRQKLKQWDKRLDEWKEIRGAIKLQIYINEGNDYLAAMVQAKQGSQWDVLRVSAGHLDELVDRMRAEEREEFHRNGDTFASRARALVDEGATLEAISRIKTCDLPLPQDATVLDETLADGSRQIEYRKVRFTVDAATWRKIEPRWEQIKAASAPKSRRGHVLKGQTRIEGMILEKDGVIVVRQRNGIELEFDAKDVSAPVYDPPAPGDGK